MAFTGSTFRIRIHTLTTQRWYRDGITGVEVDFTSEALALTELDRLVRNNVVPGMWFRVVPYTEDACATDHHHQQEEHRA